LIPQCDIQTFARWRHAGLHAAAATPREGTETQGRRQCGTPDRPADRTTDSPFTPDSEETP